MQSSAVKDSDKVSRKLAFGITILTGLALSVVGFVLAAPIGPTSGPDISNPRFTGAPLLFVIGIVLIFLSPVVYELFPGKED